MAVKFLVEHIIQERGQKPYIIVRHLIPGQNFSMTRKSFLNDIEIMSSLTSPRTLNENGEPRFDLYIFYPIYPSDIKQFEKGMTITLTNED